MKRTPKSEFACSELTEYHGRRLADGTCEVTVLRHGQKPVPLDWETTLLVRNHSPAGLNWGYGGSGPAQLALAMLLDWFEDVGFAVAYYQRFKTAFIAPIDRDEFRISGAELRAWLDAINEE